MVSAMKMQRTIVFRIASVNGVELPNTIVKAFAMVVQSLIVPVFVMAVMNQIVPESVMVRI